MGSSSLLDNDIETYTTDNIAVLVNGFLNEDIYIYNYDYDSTLPTYSCSPTVITEIFELSVTVIVFV